MDFLKKAKGGRLPDFIVIGASKTGTTSLDYYLSLHPEIHMARPKEPRFFVDRPEPHGRWGRGIDWYKSLFVTCKKCCGESSPQYARDAKQNEVAARMYSLIPRAKLIYVVREPYQRFVSQYKMMYRLLVTDRPFPDFLNNDQGAIFMSCYGSCLQEYLKYYPREQILVLESSELYGQREACLSKVFSFLGVDPGFRTKRFHREHNVASESIYPDARGRRLLRSRPFVLLKKYMSDWSFYHLRNLILLPLQGPEPSIELPADLEGEIRARFRAEVALLRKLSGQPLPSLGD